MATENITENKSYSDFANDLSSLCHYAEANLYAIESMQNGWVNLRRGEEITSPLQEEFLRTGYFLRNIRGLLDKLLNELDDSWFNFESVEQDAKAKQKA